ncbi:DUF3828 domain-containing protein [Methylocapsa sp. S129]|uniref:DUF3828 domain-containing protein n=1 Tax=Methylocapsa sp. S129 TaxID=1641869 RepID=UPI00131BF0DC|nr:DUF3828 domain-containing protein [Methylocapsa sp. S129]
MTGCKHWALAAALAGALLVSGAPARAQVNAREPDPAVWLRQIYALYHRAEKSPSDISSSTELMGKRASKSLAALFKRDDACEVKEGGVCALDWDFIIDGQAWTLSNVKVDALVVAGDKATVTVKFTNLAVACVNTYFFVREDGQWKIDDIETKSGSEAPVRIAKLLSDYDYKQ